MPFTPYNQNTQGTSGFIPYNQVSQGQSDGFLKSLITDPLKTLVVKPGVRLGQAIGQTALELGALTGSERLKVARDRGRELIGQDVRFPGAGGITVEGQKAFGEGGAKQIAGETLKSASYLYGAGEVAPLKSTFGGLIKQGTRIGTVGGGAYGAGEALTQRGGAADVFTGGLMGGILGGAAGLAFPVAGYGISKAIGGARYAFTPRAQKITQAVNELEDTYKDINRGWVQTRKASAKAERVTELKNKSGTTGRTPERVLSESGIIPEHEGTQFRTLAQADKLLEDTRLLREVNRDALKEAQLSTVPVAVNDFESKAVSRARTPANIANGTADALENGVRSAMSAYRKNYGEAVPLQTLDDIKSGRWGQSNFSLTKEDKLAGDVDYIIGKTAQEIIEETAAKAGATDVAQLNREIGDLLEAAKFLKNLDGRAVVYGKMGTYMMRLAGAIIGSKAGPLGSLAGAMGGDVVADVLRSTRIAGPIKRMLLKNLEKTDPAAYQQTLKWLEQQGLERELRPKLPAGNPDIIRRFETAPIIKSIKEKIDYANRQSLMGMYGKSEQAIRDAIEMAKREGVEFPIEDVSERSMETYLGSPADKLSPMPNQPQGNLPSLKNEYKAQTTKAVTSPSIIEKSIPPKTNLGKSTSGEDLLYTTPQKTKERGLKLLEKAFGDKESATLHAEQYWAKEGKPGVFHHATKELSPFSFEKGKVANMDIGLRRGISNVNGLYVGRDPKALHEFYNMAAERGENIITYKGNPKLLDLTDEDTMQSFVKKFKTGDQIEKELSRGGYDGIKYFDPYSTGEEIVITNQKAVRAVAFNGKPIKTTTTNFGNGKSGQLMGAFAGIETDDEGNIKFNPEKAAIGIGLITGLGKINNKAEAMKVFKGFTDITTKVLDKLKGRSLVSKQFISDLTNSPDLRQVERDLIRRVLSDMPDNVPVAEFANKVKTELLPLKTKELGGIMTAKEAERARVPQLTSRGIYENITLPSEIRGNVANYSERIYESPIKTSAGNVHFGGYRQLENAPQNYFGHTRIEDMANVDKEMGSTRRVIELQTDLYQKGALEREIQEKQFAEKGAKMVKMSKAEAPKYAKEAKDLQKLQQYDNRTSIFRMAREEIKQAAIDGKTKLQFPTGETAMKIEGLGDFGQWIPVSRVGEIDRQFGQGGFGAMREINLKPEEIKIGLEVKKTGQMGNWIIIDVLGDGKFKAVPKIIWDGANPNVPFAGRKLSIQGFRKINEQIIQRSTEQFDISGKVDTNNPIYRFYEKDIAKFLKNQYNAQLITDPRGVKWMEVNITPELKNKPITAFGVAATSLGGATVFGRKAEASDDMSNERIKGEIAFRESGKYENDNQYDTISEKTNRDGTKDYGKYQVNETTLKENARRFLGRDVSIQEFLNSPELQEKFMNKSIDHLRSLGAKSLDAFLILWHKGWSDVRSSRIRELKQDKGVVGYLGNQRYKTNLGTL